MPDHAKDAKMREMTMAQFMTSEIEPNETVLITDGPHPFVITSDYRIARAWHQAAKDLKANPTLGTRH